jgi:transposase InsO family protein
VMVAIDKFTKWIEYKHIASLTSAKAVEFIHDIIFRFGIPNSIITDLGSNFTSSEFFDFCEQRSIQIKYALIAHPRANGQVEMANGMILEALRKKVFDKNEKFAGKWIKELSYVVWSLRTQPSRALHGNTPLFMVYGSEAVLPADLKFGAPRLVFESIAKAEATILEDVDILEEERLNTLIQSARYQQTLRRYHDKAIRHRSFVVGDLVLHRILTGEGRHKLSPLWEGPFVVAEVTRPGSYRLTQMDGTEIGNSWNIEHLRKFYP